LNNEDVVDLLSRNLPGWFCSQACFQSWIANHSECQTENKNFHPKMCLSPHMVMFPPFNFLPYLVLEVMVHKQAFPPFSFLVKEQSASLE
jgi:hypothetical protein